MGAFGEESWWILPLSLAAKCNDSLSSFVLIAFFSLLSWLFFSLLHWSFPGGPAWGKLLARRGSTKHIPGPRGVPILGSLGLLRGLAHRRLAAAADRLAARRLMALSLGETRVVVTADPNVAKEILNSSVFADRPIKESAYGLMFHDAIGFAPYGAYWRMLRRISSTHLFCPRQIAAAAHRRESIAREMVAALTLNAPSLVVRGVLKRAALNNIMGSVFGRSYKFDSSSASPSSEDNAKELLFLVEEGYDLLGKLNYSDHLPFLSSFDLQGIRRRCSELVPRVNRFVGQIIDEHRKKIKDPTDGQDFVDVLLSLEGTADGLSHSEMIAVLWEMIFRGTDTVAVTIEWILARLAAHGEVQEKVHDELDRVVGRSRRVREADVASLPYLSSVIKEVIRLHPPGPLLSWARLATSDTDVGGWAVPAGTTAMVNMWAIARDPGLWPEPEAFRPERFESGSVEFTSLFGSDLRLAPFGSGRRSCPGKALAVATVSFWVAALLHDFEWLPGSTVETKGVDFSEVLRLSCEMAVPLNVKLRRRRDSTD